MDEQQLYIDRLNALLDLLESNGLKPFLMCGTLLAYIREGKPFSHDYKDIDIAIQKEDYWKFRELIDKSEDFSYYRVWRREIAVLYKLCAKIDVFFLDSKTEGDLHIYSYKPNSFTGKWDSEWRTVFNASDFYPLQRVDYPYLGRQVYIPKNPDGILETHYGDWKTPNSKWTIQEMTNVDNDYRQIAFVIPHNLTVSEKNEIAMSIRKLFPENWYRIYNFIEDVQDEPFLIILHDKYVFTKDFDINGLIQILLSKEEIGAVSIRNSHPINTFETFISRTQLKKLYIYESSREAFTMIKRDFFFNPKKQDKIAKLCEVVKDEEEK